MKRFAILLAAAVALAAPAKAADRGEAKLSLAGKAISVDYGRPTLNGRDVWKDLAAGLPVGQAWRMGADAATTLKTDADLAFGSVAVPKGSYALTAKRVDDKSWALVFKGVDGEVPFTATTLKDKVEMFTIELRGDKGAGELELKWGETALKASFTAK